LTSLLISEFSSENLVSGVFRPSCIGVAERNVKAASTSEDNGDHDNAHHWISLRISRNEKEEFSQVQEKFIQNHRRTSWETLLTPTSMHQASNVVFSLKTAPLGRGAVGALMLRTATGILS
jgi:hypothetical protein